MNISGKRILITGGARRIGAEITRLLAQSGAEMIIHCNNSTAEAQNLAESLPGAPRTGEKSGRGILRSAEKRRHSAARYDEKNCLCRTVYR